MIQQSTLRPWFTILVLGLSLLCAKTQANPSVFEVKVRGNGPAVIFIPGLMSSDRVWQDTANELVNRMQLHLISVAGFAGTKPITTPSIDLLVKELASYIETNQLEKPVVIGHSMGGLTAMALAIAHPERVGKVVSVDGLPFIGPVFTGSNQTSVETLAAQAQQMERYFAGMSSEQVAQQTQMGIQRHSTVHEAQRLIIDMAGTSDPATVGRFMHDVMSTDLRADLHQIQQPLLLVGAAGALKNDMAKSQLHKIYQQQLVKAGDARLIMHNEARHFIMLDKPGWFVEQLSSFLEGHQ